MSDITAIPVPLTDISGDIIFNSTVPYRNILAGKDSGDGIQFSPGSETGGTLEFNFYNSDGKNNDLRSGFTGLIPNYENIILYKGSSGITFANYILATDNTDYPILISDNKKIWATPPFYLTNGQTNKRVPFRVVKILFNKFDNSWYMVGSNNNNSSGYRNLVKSFDGLSWFTEDLSLKYLDFIEDLSFDKYGSCILIGSGNDYSACMIINSSVCVPILSSKTLFPNPRRVIRGPVWFIFSDNGIFESTNGIDWVRKVQVSITSVDYSDINNIALAHSLQNDRFYKRGVTGTWSNVGNINQFLGTSKTLTINEISYNPLGDGSSSIWSIRYTDYSAENKTGFFISYDNTQTWTDIQQTTPTQLWDNLLIEPPNYDNNTIFISNATTGSYGWDIFGSSGGIIYYTNTGEIPGNETSLDVQGVTGLNLTAVGSTYERDYINSIYENDFIVETSGFNTQSGATSNNKYTNLYSAEIGLTLRNGFIESLNNSIFTTIPRIQNPNGGYLFSSFELLFKTDKYSKKRIAISGYDGSYEWIISKLNTGDSNDISGKWCTVSTNTSKDTKNTYPFITDGLFASTNFIFENVYQTQITMLTDIVTELDILISKTNGLIGIKNGIYPVWYKETNIVDEKNKFYDPIELRTENGIGSYNQSSSTNIIQYLTGYRSYGNATTLKELYDLFLILLSNSLQNTDLFFTIKDQLYNIINKLRSLEFDLTYEKEFMDGLITRFSQTDHVYYLNAFLIYFSNNLKTRINNIKSDLSSGSYKSLYNSIPQLPIDINLKKPVYDENTIFGISYDGFKLRFTIDSVIIQEFLLYGNSNNNNLTVYVDFYDKDTFDKNIDNSEEVRILNPLPRVFLDIIEFKENLYTSELKTAIRTAFNNKFNTEQLQNYLTNITKLGLIPDSDVTGLTGRFYDINGTQMNSLFSNITTPIIYDCGNKIINTWALYYLMSHYVNDDINLLRRLGNLIVNSSTPSYTTSFTYDTLWGATGSVITSLNNSINDLKNIFENLDTYYGYGGNPINIFLSNYVTKSLEDRNLLFNRTNTYDVKDYTNFYDKVFKCIYDYQLNVNYGYINNDYYKNPVNLNNNVRYPRLASRKFLFDVYGYDMDKTIQLNKLPNAYFGNENLIIDKQKLFDNFVSGPTGDINSFLEKLEQITDTINGITGISQFGTTGLTEASLRINKSLYCSFFTELINNSGLTGTVDTIISQTNEPYKLLHDYIFKIKNETNININNVDTYLLSPEFNDILNSSTNLPQNLHDLMIKDNSFLLKMNDLLTYDGHQTYKSMLMNNLYNTMKNSYMDYVNNITKVSSTTINNLLPTIYSNVVLPSIIQILKSKFYVEPSNKTYFLTKHQENLAKNYFNFVDGITSSDYSAMTSKTYSLVNNRYVDVNSVYTTFANNYLGVIEGLVDDVFNGTTGIDDDLEVLQAIVYGGSGISGTTGQQIQDFLTIQNNLVRQGNLYKNLMNSNSGVSGFNQWRVYMTNLSNISEDIKILNKTSSTILNSVPAGMSGGANITTNDSGIQDFIVNIPPCDNRRWVVTSITGATLSPDPRIYNYARYNPNMKYYYGDLVLFDGYGTTENKLYQCLETKRVKTIKGVSPGTLGPTGTINSILCWKEFHDLPPFKIETPPELKKPNEFYNYNEKIYNLSYGISSVTGRIADVYDSNKTYYRGDQVFLNNSIYKCLGSEYIYKNIGIGIPPGFDDTLDKNWKVLGTAGIQLYEYPASNGVWYRDPTFNLPFVKEKYTIMDIKSKKNVYNKFIVPLEYDYDISYKFGDKVTFEGSIYTYTGTSTYTTQSGLTGAMKGITPPSLDNYLGNVLWKACPFIDLSKEGRKITPFNINSSYNVGEMVIYNNMAYRFIYDNLNVQNYNSGGQVEYNFGELVEYLGYIFISKIDTNLGEPYVPYNISALEATQYWMVDTGYTGTQPLEYNFKHDYCSDFHINNKGEDIHVSFANKVWKWIFNPYNVNYKTQEQQTLVGLSCVKGIRPPDAEPFNEWILTNDLTVKANDYDKTKNYYALDYIFYGGFTFLCTGYGYGTAIVNTEGDELDVDIYRPLEFLENGNIKRESTLTTFLGNQHYIKDASGHKYLETTRIEGNYTDNYRLDNYGNDYYGIPKWGNGVDTDIWGKPYGFCLNLRRKFIPFEITSKALTHNVSFFNQNFTNYSVPLAITNLLKSKYKTLNSSLISTVPSTQTLRTLYDNVFTKHYFGLIVSMVPLYKQIKLLQTKINEKKTEAKDLFNRSGEAMEISVYLQLYRAYFEKDRYYPGINGIPINSMDLGLNGLITFPEIPIKANSAKTNMDEFLAVYNKISTKGINSELFTKKGNGLTGAYFYDKTTGLKTNSTNGIYLIEGLIDKTTDTNYSNSYPFHMFSPNYTKLTFEYNALKNQSELLIKIIKDYVGSDMIFELLNDNLFTDENHTIYNDKYYGNGILEYTGYDEPLMVPILSKKDIDLFINIKLGSPNAEPYLGYDDLGSGNPFIGYSKTHNSGIIEPLYVNKIIPNLFQFDDIEAILRTLEDCPYTTLFSNPITYFRTKIKDHRLSINSGVEKGVWQPPPNNELSAQLRRYSGITGQWDVWEKTGYGNTDFIGGTGVFYQPYGYIQKNDHRTPNDKDRLDDEARDIKDGFYSASAGMIYNGMGYGRPNLVYISREDLLRSQGKHDITDNKNYQSLWAFISHICKYKEIQPDYTTVYSGSGKDILMFERRIRSQNLKDKTIAIVGAIFASVFLIVLIVLTFFTGGAAAPLVAMGIGLVIGLACAISEIPGTDPKAKRFFQNITTNPILAFYEPPDLLSPENLQARCAVAGGVLKTLSLASNNYDSNDYLDDNTLAVRYEEYAYCKQTINLLLDQASNIIPDLNKKLIGYSSYETKLYYQANGITGKNYVQALLRSKGITGVSGSQNVTSIEEYENLVENSGLTGTSVKDIEDIFSSIMSNYQIVRKYERQVKYPQFSTYTVIYRPALVRIKAIQYGSSILNKKTGLISKTSTFVPNAKIYAKCEIIDPGEGLYEYDPDGNLKGTLTFLSEDNERTFQTYNINGTTGPVFKFTSMLSVSTDYCDSKSYFGLESIVTPNEPMDYGSMVIEYSNPSNAPQDLIGKIFKITNDDLGIIYGGASLTNTKFVLTAYNPNATQVKQVTRSTPLVTAQGKTANSYVNFVNAQRNINGSASGLSGEFNKQSSEKPPPKDIPKKLNKYGDDLDFISIDSRDPIPDIDLELAPDDISFVKAKKVEDPVDNFKPLDSSKIKIMDDDAIKLSDDFVPFDLTVKTRTSIGPPPKLKNPGLKRGVGSRTLIPKPKGSKIINQLGSIPFLDIIGFAVDFAMIVIQCHEMVTRAEPQITC